MTPSELYDHIFLEGTRDRPVTLAVPAEQYESLRVTLSRYHRKMRDSSFTNESLCARFDKDTGHAKFWIGDKVVNRGISFTLIQDDDTQIRNDLASD